MRSFDHWTPQYLIDRSVEKLYRLTHPGLPWLSPQANNYLERYLSSDMVGIEFGSGRSTLYFARKVNRLISVEHNPKWYKTISDQIQKEEFENVEYHLCPQIEGEDPRLSKYVNVGSYLKPESLDFALIDGIYRDYCAISMLEKIKPGGILIIDNVNKYLPGKTHSPNSIKFGQELRSKIWCDLRDSISSWVCEWSSNGISDTAIYVKPTINT